MEKYIVYQEPFSEENILSIHDTLEEANSDAKFLGVFGKMTNTKKPSVGKISISEKELEQLLN